MPTVIWLADDYAKKLTHAQNLALCVIQHSSMGTTTVLVFDKYYLVRTSSIHLQYHQGYAMQPTEFIRKMKDEFQMLVPRFIT